MNNLKTYRQAIGLTQRELASLAGCTPGAISHWESGKRQLTIKTCRTLIKILKAYGVFTSMDRLTLSSIESLKINLENTFRSEMAITQNAIKSNEKES